MLRKFKSSNPLISLRRLWNSWQPSFSLGIDAAVLEKAERRREYGVLPLTSEVITNQQKIADTFQQLKLIPKPIKIEDAVWKGAA